MLKIDPDLQFLKSDRFSFGNVNMAKVYERLLFTISPQEKGRDSFDPRGLNLLGHDSIWMVNPLEISRMIDCSVFFFVLF